MAEGFNNLGSVYQALGQCNEGKEYHLKRLIIIERFSEKGMMTVVATSYISLGSGQLYKLLDSRMKQTKTTTRH